MAQIKDFTNAAALALTDLFPLSQNGNTRKITLQSIKEFLLGTTTLTTTDTTITGAIQELKGKVDTNTTSLSETVNKTSIVNNLTATVPGSVLDATQGKAINDNLIANYIGKRTIGTTDFNNIVQNGFYEFAGTFTNSNGLSYGILEVIRGSSYIVQRATNIISNATMQRTSTDNGSTWLAWKNITMS